MQSELTRAEIHSPTAVETSKKYTFLHIKLQDNFSFHR